MMLALEITLVVLLFGVGGFGFVALLRSHARRVESLWRDGAARLGGEFQTDASWFDPSYRITAVLDGQPVALESGRKNEVRARATAAHQSGFELRVYPRPPEWLVARQRAVTTEDPLFDRLFAAEATDPALGAAWLDSTVRERISRAGSCFVHVRDGSVIGTRTVFAFESEALERLAHAVATIAARGNRLGPSLGTGM